MDQKLVGKLEAHIERAIVEVIIRLSKAWQLPLLPSQHTMHLMAKAAMAVYEAAVEAHEIERRGKATPE